MWTDCLGNEVTLDSAASLPALNDFVERFIASEARGQHPAGRGGQLIGAQQLLQQQQLNGQPESARLKRQAGAVYNALGLDSFSTSFR